MTSPLVSLETTGPPRRQDWERQCGAVIPCLNERGRIGRVVRGVRQHLTEVIVVDDGSNDGTGEEAVAAGARVVRHPRSRGKGAALCSGWREVRALGLRWAMCLDGDGQHAPGDIPAFLRAAELSGAPLVVGNRMADAHHMPWLRRRVNAWMSRRISGATDLVLPDTQCGMRLMNLGAWDRPLNAARFEVESEIILSFARQGHRIQFVPIRVIYQDEKSKIRPLRDTLRWFRWWAGVKPIQVR